MASFNVSILFKTPPNDDQFTYVGELEGENRKAEIGVVVNPFDIVKRIKTGYYDFVYPQFE